MKVTQKPPIHAANLVANNGKTAYGVDVIITLIFGTFPSDVQRNDQHFWNNESE